jgi:hypothetical protein
MCRIDAQKNNAAKEKVTSEDRCGPRLGNLCGF